ncbi:MAG: hypothetical protein ACSHXB_19305 [Sulfitobacter sp.]
MSSSLTAYAQDRLGTTVFETSSKADDTHIFHTSLESAIEQFRWTANGARASNESFRLNAGFLNTFSPNALADHYEGEYFLGIHVALIVAINEFAMFCFAQQEFFPDIGDRSKESSPKPWNERLPGIWLLDNTLTPPTPRPRNDFDDLTDLRAIDMRRLQNKGDGDLNGASDPRNPPQASNGKLRQ